MSSNPASRIANLAGRRRQLIERGELLDATPRPPAEARAAVADLVAQAAARVRPPLNYLLRRGGDGAGLVESLRHVATRDIPGAPGLFELLCAAAAPSVTAWLQKELEGAYAGRPKPITAVEFEKAAATLAAELVEVERELATVWWQAIDDGIDLPPPEISIEAMLGVQP